MRISEGRAGVVLLQLQIKRIFQSLTSKLAVISIPMAWTHWKDVLKRYYFYFFFLQIYFHTVCSVHHSYSWKLCKDLRSCSAVYSVYIWPDDWSQLSCIYQNSYNDYKKYQGSYSIWFIVRWRWWETFGVV